MKTKLIISLTILSAALAFFSCEEVIIEPTEPQRIDAWTDRSVPAKGHQPRKEADPLYDRQD